MLSHCCVTEKHEKHDKLESYRYVGTGRHSDWLATTPLEEQTTEWLDVEGKRIYLRLVRSLRQPGCN
jgi:hypothetical protein